MDTRNVAVMIFDDVEVLDFCGPFEVFSVAGRRAKLDPFNVYTVAETAAAVLARNALSVNPRFTLANCPTPDILLVPGGYGTRPLLEREPVVSWIRETAGAAELTLSVCTGALLLAKAGLLDGLGATTHFGSLELLAELAPKTRVEHGVRFVDNGSLITSAGVSAGIDMSLHVVSRLLGAEHARETAAYMEYDWRP